MKLSTKKALVLALGISLVLSLAVGSGVVLAEEEVMVPFGEIKSSCYSEIDMSKAEFALSEVGEECVNEEWLEKSKPEVESSSEKRITKEEKEDYRIKAAQGSERDAINLSWQYPPDKAEDSINITIKVYDESYIHQSYIEGEKEDTINFLAFPETHSGWGEVIKGLPKEKFKGPGGFVEKAEVPVEQEGDNWTGRVKINLQKTVHSFGIWKSTTPEKGYYTFNVVSKPKGKLAAGQPTLEEVVKEVNTPKDLAKFMSYYFISKYHKGRTAHPPRKFLKLKKGDCTSFAVFSGYVLKENGYKAKQLVYSRQTVKGAHTIPLYWQKGELYYLDREPVKVTVFGPFSDIEALLQNQIERIPESTKKITCYTIVPPTKLRVDKPLCLHAPPE